MENVNFNNETLLADDPTISTKDNSISFTGAIAVDPLNLLNGLALAQNLLLQPISWTFAKPVSEVSFNADVLNVLGSATINYYDQNGNLLHSTSTSGLGEQTFSYSNPNIAQVQITGSDLSALTIDSISYQDTNSMITTVSNPTGNPLIEGHKWASTHLTYSMPGSSGEYTSEGYHAVNGFQTLSSAASNEVQQFMANISNDTGLTLTQTTSAGANIRLGAASSIDTGDGSGSHAVNGSTVFGPGSGSETDTGDIWLQAGSTVTPLELMKDVGESLGLKAGGLGGVHDSIAYSVMSNDTYPGGSPTDMTTVDAPSTLMQDDIAALQAIYGANYGINAGNTVYTWNPNTGEESINGVGQGAPADGKVFMTVWDGGGNDTFDFSNFTSSLHVNLKPGHWVNLGSSSLLAGLGDGHDAPGDIALAQLYHGNQQSMIENATGGSGNDFIEGNVVANTLIGGAGKDSLHGLGGNDILDGGAGSDYLVGGRGNDTYLYSTASDSTGTNFDTVRTFSVQHDKFDLWFQVTGLDHASHGVLDASAFNSDLAAATSNLEAHHAELFHATSGSFAGDTFLVIDANGQAGYQAGSDLVIRLDNVTHAHDLSVSDFVTT